MQAFVWHNGRAWITCGAHRHRVAALRRDPRCSVVVSGIAAPDGPNGAITIKGRAIIHEDEETKRWFYPALASMIQRGDPAQSRAFAEFLDSPLRVILEVTPEKWITSAGAKMELDSAGQLPPERKTKPASSDTERLAAELKRRGIA